MYIRAQVAGSDLCISTRHCLQNGIVDEDVLLLRSVGICIIACGLVDSTDALSRYIHVYRYVRTSGRPYPATATAHARRYAQT